LLQPTRRRHRVRKDPSLTQIILIGLLQGFSYAIDESPSICFNGEKKWQLGWHKYYHVDIPVGYDFNWKGNLVGFAEKSSASGADRMIVRIRSTMDYYVHFNRKIGRNSGTMEGADQVLVSSRIPETGLAVSSLLAKLSSGGEFTIPNFMKSTLSLKIVVTAINMKTVPARASVSVQFEVLLRSHCQHLLPITFRLQFFREHLLLTPHRLGFFRQWPLASNLSYSSAPPPPKRACCKSHVDRSVGNKSSLSSLLSLTLSASGWKP
jgi:hypothetical protein